MSLEIGLWRLIIHKNLNFAKNVTYDGVTLCRLYKITHYDFLGYYVAVYRNIINIYELHNRIIKETCIPLTSLNKKEMLGY